MDCGSARTAVFETTVFLRYFKDMLDPRPRGKVLYRLDEVLLLTDPKSGVHFKAHGR